MHVYIYIYTYICMYISIYMCVCVCANMYIMYLLCSVVCRHIHASHMYQPSQAMEVAGRGASVRSLSINHIVSWVGTYPLPIYLSQFPNETECGLLVVDVLVSAQVASFFGDVVSPPTEMWEMVNSEWTTCAQLFLQNSTWNGISSHALRHVKP